MRFAQDDDVVKAVAADRAHKAFREWILARGLRRGLDPFNAKPSDALAERGPVNAVTVTQKVARRIVLREGVV